MSCCNFALWSTAYKLERFGTERACNAGMGGNAVMHLGSCRNMGVAERYKANMVYFRLDKYKEATISRSVCIRLLKWHMRGKCSCPDLHLYRVWQMG